MMLLFGLAESSMNNFDQFFCYILAKKIMPNMPMSFSYTKF